MIGPDDPRLTAYAVDEVDAETALAVERALQDHASIAAAIDETHEAARLVRALFAAEGTPALTDAQRRAIAAAAARAGRPHGRTAVIGGGLAAAAAVAFAVILLRAPQQPALPPPVPAPVPTPVPTPASVATPPVPAPAPEGKPAAPPPVVRQRRLGPATVTVRGTVQDQMGERVPGATITVRSLTDGAERTATSGTDGGFRLRDVPPGALEVRAELSGFNTYRADVIADGGATVSFSPTLRVASLQEEVTITGESPVISVSSGSVSSPVSDDDTESYGLRVDNAFSETRHHPLSTFALDVDTASYSNVRSLLTGDEELPPVDAVRIEELVNYFPYDYAPPFGRDRFAAALEVGPAPWNPEHRLLRIGLKTRDLDTAHRPAGNLVFLVDVSGSMEAENKLPLVRQSLRLLVEQLTPRDRVAIVVYAGAAGLVLPSTPGDQGAAIAAAIDRLEAGGSTNGGEGIDLAYAEAARGFVKGGVNRVILATDGDFNVGVTDLGALVRLAEEKARSGVFLSVLGFGRGNLKDSVMEGLADHGNGNYAYVDSLREAQKTLVEQMAGTLVTVAKDAKIQVEFNPARVRAYRLLGYENRLLRPEDFKDDTKDAGEVGAGHTVTALYELVPASGAWGGPQVDPLRYVAPGQLTDAARSDELLRMKLRYKEPEGRKSRQQQWTLVDRGQGLAAASNDFRFAAAVAQFGMLLRDAPDKGASTYESVIELAAGALGDDRGGYRAEFVELAKKARALKAEARE